MSETDPKRVERYVSENEPAEQDDVVAEFGRRGLSALRTLMRENRVSYTVDWKLHTDERNTRFPDK